MNRRIRHVVAVVVVVAALAGCSKARREPDTPTADGRPLPRVTTTSTAPRPTTSTVPVGQEDFLAVMRHILEVADRAGEVVDASLLLEVDDPTCPCYANGKRIVEELASRHERGAGERVAVHTVEVVARTSPTLVILRVVISQGPNWIVGPTGEKVRDADTFGPTRFVVTLVNNGAVWRMLDSQEEGPAK